jgi:hypothetical protein
VTRRIEKLGNIVKSSQNSCQAKQGQKIYTQYESLEQPRQITSETLKYHLKMCSNGNWCIQHGKSTDKQKIGIEKLRQMLRCPRAGNTN